MLLKGIRDKAHITYHVSLLVTGHWSPVTPLVRLLDTYVTLSVRLPLQLKRDTIGRRNNTNNYGNHQETGRYDQVHNRNQIHIQVYRRKQKGYSFKGTRTLHALIEQRTGSTRHN